jgi:rhomboid protease GluP
VRKTSGTIVCPSCRRLIEVNEPRCPYCNMPRPGLWGFAPALRRLLGGVGDLSQLIAGACIALYLLALLIDPHAALSAHGLFDFLSPGSRALFILGMTGDVIWRAGHWWTLLSAIYLHGSLLHIFFNVWWIRQLGPTVEDVYGGSRFYIIFTVSGAFGFLVSNVLSGAPTIGASGSIFGLMAALIVHGRRTGHQVMTRQMITLAAMIFLLGFVMSSVNNYAHAGGFVGGWVAAEALGAGLRGHAGNRLRLAAVLCAVASALAILASVVTILWILASAR